MVCNDCEIMSQCYWLLLEADHLYLGTELAKLWLHEFLCSAAAAARETPAPRGIKTLSAV